MEIINQQTFFIRFKFLGMTKYEERKANKGLRNDFNRLHRMPMDFADGSYYLMEYYKWVRTITETEKPMTLMTGLMFEVAWMGSVVDIDMAAQRLVDIVKKYQIKYNIPEITINLAAEANEYKNIKY